MHPAIGVAHSSTWQQQELHPPWTDLQSALAPCLFYCRSMVGHHPVVHVEHVMPHCSTFRLEDSNLNLPASWRVFYR